MKILQLIQKCLAMFGLKSPDATQTHSINIESVTSFSAFGMGIISNLIYLVRDVSSFFEYVEWLYIIFAASISFEVFAFFTWKMTVLFELISKLETIIQNSEQRHFFGQF